MNSNTPILSAIHLLAALLAATLAAATAASAATVWNGPLITYTQPGTNATEAANQDRLTPKVWLTRAATQGLFNAKNETSYDKETRTRPSDTEWAYGQLADFASLTYTTWYAMHANDPVSMVGRQAVLHLKSEDIYLAIKFTAWGVSGVGGFGYERSTPSVGLPTPTVSITNPVNGTVFAEPANVNIIADAAVSSGSVTNVAFFDDNILLGSAQSAPFGITTGSLSAGDYSLTAIATAAGISATSAVVIVTVVTPVVTALSTPTITNGLFSFDYAANPGLAYVVENSSNLVAWLPVVTNVAVGNPAHFATPLVPDPARLYRVGRLPNP